MWRTGRWIVLGGAAVLVLLELMFRVLPTSTATRTGYYIDPNILTYPPGHSFRTSFGWDLERPQRHHANNFGFVAEHDFVPDPKAVALIGDSYVEASMLPPSQRIAAQLEQRWRGRPVYAFGGPGSSLLDYVERIRFADSKFAIREFVLVLERGDVIQSLCGSGNVHAACIDAATLAPRTERIPNDQRLLANLARQSALAQYLFTQLRFSVSALVGKARSLFVRKEPAPPRAAPSPQQLERIDAIVRTFIERLEPYKDRNITLVVGSDLNALKADRPAPPDPAKERLMAAARARGLRVIDTEPIFRTHMAQSPLSLAVSPRDGHWNGLAIGLVADAVASGGPGL
jgi:hypothetical protein